MGIFDWFRRKKVAAEGPTPGNNRESDWKVEIQREAELRDRGWVPFYNPYGNTPSPHGRLIDIIDREGNITTTHYSDIPPWWNVAGKMWRVSVFAPLGEIKSGEIDRAKLH